MQNSHIPYFQPYLPEAIIRSKNPLDLRVYTELLILDKSLGDDVCVLPPRREMAKLCGCDAETLTISYRRLEASGWLRTIDIPGKSQRKRILLRVIKPTITQTELMEGTERGKRSTLKATPDGVVTLHNIYTDENLENTSRTGSFPPELHELKLRCKNRDKNGRSLADIPDWELFNASGCAPYTEIEIAMFEVENFKPSTGKAPDTIVGAFSRLFIKGKGGVAGMLNPNRRSLIVSTKMKLRHNLVTPKKLTSQGVTGFVPAPDAGMPESHIDWLCKKFNSREWVEIGSIPATQFPRHERIFDRHSVEPKVRVRDEFELVRVSSGYWNVVALEMGFNNDKRCSTTRPISSGMSSLLKRASSDN